MSGIVIFCAVCELVWFTHGPSAAQEPGSPLAGTKPLTMTGDIASELVAGVDRFLLKQIDASTADRAKHWKRDLSSAAAYQASIEPNRRRLAHILGVRDSRVRSGGPRLHFEPLDSAPDSQRTVHASTQ